MLEASPMCPVEVANQTWWANVLLEHYGIPGLARSPGRGIRLELRRAPGRKENPCPEGDAGRMRDLAHRGAMPGPEPCRSARSGGGRSPCREGARRIPVRGGPRPGWRGAVGLAHHEPPRPGLRANQPTAAFPVARDRCDPGNDGSGSRGLRTSRSRTGDQMGSSPIGMGPRCDRSDRWCR